MLLKNENQIIRVLKSQGDKALVIDCIKRTMPHWVDSDFLSNLVDCGEDEMYERTDYPFGRELSLLQRPQLSKWKTRTARFSLVS